MMGYLNNDRTSIANGDGKRVNEGPVSLKYSKEMKAQKSVSSPPSLRKQTGKQASKIPSEDCDGVIRVPSGSGYRMMTPFPWLLHEMLEDIEKKDLGWIVSWMPDGRAFQVHSAERFADTVLPTYFRHKRYKSFQRQLYLYGFRSLQDDSIVKGKYFHPLFTRENRSLCSQIVRPKSASTNSARPRSSRTFKKASQIDTPSESNTRALCGSNDRAMFDFNQPIVLSGGSFEPLSSNRSVTALAGSSALSKLSQGECQEMQSWSLVPKVTGLVPASVEGTPRTMKQASHTLLKNTQLAMFGMPSTSQSSFPDTTSRPIMANMNHFESNPIDPEGPIYSMSLGNLDSMNFEACPSRHAADSSTDGPVSPWNYGTASIQELEPYSDSIIKLFGSNSESTTWSE